MAKNKLRALKIKLANLQLEIQSLIEKSERDPSLIEAITSDISEFTESVTNITRQLSNLKKKKVQKESISLTNLYEEVQNNEEIRKRMRTYSDDVGKKTDELKKMLKEKGYNV